MSWGLLGSIGNAVKSAGRGIVNGIDNAAVNSLTGGGLMDAALGSNGEPFTPTDHQRKGLRGQFLMGIGGALQQGRPIAEGIQQYQQNAIGQIQAGQQAQQQQKARTMRDAFQSELQAAPDDAARQKVMVKWAPFFPKEVQDLAGAIKATKPDVLKLEKTDTLTGPDGRPVLVDTFSDGSRRPVANYSPNTKITWENIGGEKVPLNEQGQRVVGLPSLQMGRSPDSIAQDQRTQPLNTDKGVVAFNPMTQAVSPVVGADGKTLMPYQAPSRLDTGARDAAREDRSYQFHSRELDTLEKPVTEALSRSSRLIETLDNGSPVALAAAIPEFLTVMSGGAGSGLRMTEAEMKRIVGGRSVWEELTAAASRFSTNPQQYPLTAGQVGSIRKMAESVTAKLVQKQEAINQARGIMGTSGNVVEHRNALNNMRMRFQAIDGATGQPSGGPAIPAGWSVKVR